VNAPVGRLRIQPAGWSLLLLVLLAAPAQATIEYRVSLARRSDNLVHVTMTVPEVTGELVVQMPAWNALYQIRDFAHHVREVRARDAAGAPLTVAKSDKLSWNVNASGAVTLDYSAHWDEPGPFAAQVDHTHAFLNLAMVLFYVPLRRGEDVAISFSDFPADWKIAVALAAGSSPGTFRAASYDALVDAPVEISRFEEFGFTAADAKVRVVVHGPDWKRAALEEKLRRIVTYQVGLMRDVPFAEFLFIYHFGAGSGGGGMEHANSTAIFAGSDATVEGLSAHEFFHLWNVKRIRPQSLEPVDYTRENWTRALWFAEGVTSTYADFTLLRSGLWSREQYYASLAGEIGTLESRPAARWQSVEQASLDAWHEKYALYRRPESSISYYNKGQILGVLMDLLIRDATDNRRSLDDVLRHLNQEYARQGRFYDDSSGIQQAVETVAGASFEEFFTRYVAGADPLPYEKTFALAGLELRPRGEGYEIVETARASARQRRIREGLLRGSTD
jgi:predicted metalloprotease with PDZ domain